MIEYFLEWLATYGEGKDEMKSGMWNYEMMIEYAEFHHTFKMDKIITSQIQ